MNKKKLFVISGPSGAGLREILSAVLAERSDLGEVVPITARKMKEGEQNGNGFWFYDLEEWNALKESGNLLEQTEFAGNDYGTSRVLVEAQLNAGKNVLLSMDTARAAQIKKNMPEAVCVYIEPDQEILRARYEKNARNAIDLSARLEMAEKERAISGFCDVRISSNDRDEAVRQLNALLDG